MKLYNSKSKKIEVVTPLITKKISIYVCGVTPYDTTHLGHAFLYVFFDALIRYIRFQGYAVTYVQNVTDIDDDIIKRADLEGRDWRELGTFWTEKFLADLKQLNVLMPDHYVKATDSMPMIITIVKSLIAKGAAYEKEGNVYFSVDSFPRYGDLSHFSKEQMLLISQERGANIHDSLKKNPLDFILWQKSHGGQPSWESPWGNGRPGWHIECSAMIKQYLGDQIDIHGGGRDLIYPHHESEIAQSESESGKTPFVKYWLHAAMVMYQGEKMSKSLKNLVMVSNLLKDFSANTVRYVLLSHHYRSPWEFDESELPIAKQHVETLQQLAREATGKETVKNEYFEKFTEYLSDDFHIDQGLSYLVTLAADTSADSQKKAHALARALPMLGFVD